MTHKFGVRECRRAATYHHDNDADNGYHGNRHNDDVWVVRQASRVPVNIY